MRSDGNVGGIELGANLAGEEVTSEGGAGDAFAEDKAVMYGGDGYVRGADVDYEGGGFAKSETVSGEGGQINIRSMQFPSECEVWRGEIEGDEDSRGADTRLGEVKCRDIKILECNFECLFSILWGVPCRLGHDEGVLI